jgi:hypothetical protein
MGAASTFVFFESASQRQSLEPNVLSSAFGDEYPHVGDAKAP